MNTYPPILNPEKTAFFFDYDGTLTVPTAYESAFGVASEAIDILSMLDVRSGGAIAMITGRPVAYIASALAPLRIAIAGQHGSEILRYPLQTATVERIGFDDPSNATRFEQVTAMLSMYPELQICLKDTGINVIFGEHHALKSIAAAALTETINAVADNSSAFELELGKCNVETRPAGIDKGTAIQSFMAHAPFKGRIPFYVGDDLADEIGFKTVNALEGISLKIGSGDTAAKFRIAEVPGFIHWLRETAESKQFAESL